MLGEKGQEFVFDADTTRGLDRLAPQILEKLNRAKLNHNLQIFLSFMLPNHNPQTLHPFLLIMQMSQSSQTIVIPSPSAPEDDDYGSDGGGGGVLIASGGGGDDPFSTLYQGG
jgi:hypothetical protein